MNWTQEADESAASYLDSGSFSHGFLMDQLLHEGFTKKQAAHGVKPEGQTYELVSSDSDHPPRAIEDPRPTQHGKYQPPSAGRCCRAVPQRSG